MGEGLCPGGPRKAARPWAGLSSPAGFLVPTDIKRGSVPSPGARPLQEA